MPLIEVVHAPGISDDVLQRLAEALPDAVAEGVACPEEPWVGPPGPGDIDVRFHRRGPFDVGGLELVVEVRTKLFESRRENKHERSRFIHDRIAAAAPELRNIGVWLVLSEGSWFQSGEP